MKEFIKTLEVRWSDLDPNFHMLHSRYYDIGAYCRMSYMVDNGLSQELMAAQHIGPILFREECIFKRELRFGDSVKVDVEITKATPDFARWSMVHQIWKNEDILAAIIHIDGAWIDTNTRKLARPGQEIQAIFDNAPKSKEFISLR